MKEIIIDKEFYENHIKEIEKNNCIALTSFMIMVFLVVISLVFLLSGILLGYFFNTIFAIVSLILAVGFFSSFYYSLKKYNEHRRMFLDFIKSLQDDTYFRMKL